MTVDPLARVAAALATRYRIQRELGAGGMATVYLAEDLKHDRNVAVKVFRPELAAALGTERFFREIKITANLNHPHILPLLDSGEADGFLYYVMPLVEGDSLRSKLNREKQLQVDEALKITSQVASALSYAHSHDVVHRDIKPENILFQAGEVVVADFGIALALDSAGGTRLTETGFSLGTPAYMSPEQVSGEQEIDGRSDIYSLACVLYEMLAGDPPFVASSPRAVLAKHVTDPAPPIRTVRSDVPTPVAAALNKALGKAPVARFESAKAFSEALFAQPREAEDGIKSIVVLPFENLSPDAENEYFTDGLTDELIADLSRLSSLRVISRNSAMQLKGTNKDTKTIGRDLNVQYMLEGTVRRVGDRLRITAQLIDAEHDSHLWTEKYDGVLEDVFDMQDKVSSSIVSALQLKLTPAEERRIKERPIENVQAYQCYLRARQEALLCTAEALERATQYLRTAYDIVGDNALIHSGMGYVHVMYANLGWGHEEHIEKAEEYANKALALDPESAEAHLVLGLVSQWFHGEQVRAITHFKRVLATNPGDSHALMWLAVSYTMVGRVEHCWPLIERLRRVDPLNPMSWYNAFFEVFSGKLDFSREYLSSWVRTEAHNPAAVMFTAWFLALCGFEREVPEFVQQHVDATVTDVFTNASLLYSYAATGKADGIRDRVTEDVKKTAGRDPQYSHALADMYALAGMKDDALDWLENALNRGWVNYPFSVQSDPLFVPFHYEPRFREIAERMKREWEGFEA